MHFCAPNKRFRPVENKVEAYLHWFRPTFHKSDILYSANSLTVWHFRLSDICKEPVTVRTSSGWRSCEDVEDRLPDGRHAWLWWRSRASSTCFTNALLVHREEGGDIGPPGGHADRPCRFRWRCPSGNRQMSLRLAEAGAPLK
jgi:hypothetical protein